MSPTTVRNVRDGTYDPTNPEHMYIGRANRRWHLPESKWANGVPLVREIDRPFVVTQYRLNLGQRPDLMAALPELRGKTLYCWCPPKLCHGDVLAELADRFGGLPEEAEEVPA